MAKETTYSENLKIRLTSQQMQMIKQAARNENMAISSFMRCLLFSSPAESRTVQKRNLILLLNDIYNHINTMENLPEKYRSAVLEEVAKCSFPS